MRIEPIHTPYGQTIGLRQAELLGDGQMLSIDTPDPDNAIWTIRAEVYLSDHNIKELILALRVSATPS